MQPWCVLGYTVLSGFVQVHSMMFAQRRNRLTTHFSERIPVVKRRMAVVPSVAKSCISFISISSLQY